MRQQIKKTLTITKYVSGKIKRLQSIHLIMFNNSV
jgi:hypothetical protein